MEDYAKRCKSFRVLPAITDKLPGGKWLWAGFIVFGLPMALLISQMIWCLNLMIFDWWTRP